MTEATLVARALEYRDLRARATELEAQAAEVAGALMAELARRNADAVEARGVKVAMLSSTRRTYDVERAKALLPPSVLRRITAMVISSAAVAAEVEAGRLSAEHVAGFTDETRSAPYVRVSGHPRA